MKIVKRLVAAAVIAGAMFGARYAAANGDDLTAFTLANGKESRENAAGGFRIFILGNSITTVTGWVHEWGMAASAREKDYAHLIIADMEASLGLQANYVIRNIARLEQSDDWDLATEMSEEIALGADYIVIALGENLGSRDTVTYENRLYALANAFRTGGRKPRIVFRSPFWNNTTVANITRHVADSVGAKYVDAGPLGNDDSNKAIGEYDDAGVAQHPNDKGMLAIANLILPALKAPDTMDDPSDETVSAFNSIDPVGGFADLGSEGASEPDAPLVGGTSSPTSPMTTAAAGAGGSDGVCGGNGSTGNGGAGLANTGAGGGGGGWPNTPSGGAGGSGIVVIRYTYTGRIGPPPLNYGQPFEVSSSATECPLAADAATTGAVAAVRGVGGDWTRLPCGDFVHVFSTVGGHEFLAPTACSFISGNTYDGYE